MKYSEKKLVEHLQLTLARLINHGEYDCASRIAPVVEAATNGDYVFAVYYAEVADFPAYYVRKMQKVFRVKPMV